LTNCILFSGGVDSLIGWFRMGKPAALYCSLGHRYEGLELNATKNLEDVTPELKVTDIDLLSNLGQFEKEDAEIPGRNFQLAFAAAINGYDHIGVVCQKDERSIPDRSIYFFGLAEKTLSYLFNRKIILDPVFPEHDKTEMIKWFLDTELGIERGHKIEILKATVACYQPRSNRQCGNCPACFRRAVAFCNNGIFEVYAQDVWCSPIAKEYLRKAKNGSYSEDRNNRILNAFVEAGVLLSADPEV